MPGEDMSNESAQLGSRPDALTAELQELVRAQEQGESAERSGLKQLDAVVGSIVESLPHYRLTVPWDRGQELDPDEASQPEQASGLDVMYGQRTESVWLTDPATGVKGRYAFAHYIQVEDGVMATVAIDTLAPDTMPLDSGLPVPPDRVRGISERYTIGALDDHDRPGVKHEILDLTGGYGTARWVSGAEMVQLAGRLGGLQAEVAAGRYERDTAREG